MVNTKTQVPKQHDTLEEGQGGLGQPEQVGVMQCEYGTGEFPQQALKVGDACLPGM